ncbi:hypothetical protein G7K71_17625 [Desulfofundulus sp. TPOSR]|uniref:SLC13 family permease n=1 Tax=Desulfofundulus sp. TPOSR TaxID=2714340 RepID=UPI00140ACB22|nr:SLC13 family permease [Desulfofundulus sp. TPOSR]NHM28749.1 hypothetical protein [Desulfofundulus sp. TPOSR]
MKKKTLLLVILVGLSIVPLKLLPDREAVLLILLMAVIMWNTLVIPGIYGSMLVLVLMATGSKVDSMEEVFSGFASQELFFLLSVTLIGISFARQGLINYFVMRWARFCRSILLSRLFCMGVSLLMPLLIPSAAVRTRLIEPVIKELSLQNGFSLNGWFVRSTVLLIGGTSSVASLAFMTGGVNTIMAAEMLSDLMARNITWFLWLLLMLPLAWLMVFLCTLMLPLLFRGKEVASEKIASGCELNFNKKLSFQEKIAAGVVLLMIIFWVTEPLTGINPVIVALTGVILLALPGVEIIQKRDLNAVDWDTLILLGTAFSLGNLIKTHGVGEWMTGVFITKFSAIGLSSPGLSFLSMLLLLCFVRVFFVSPVTFLTLSLPIVYPITGAMGLNPYYFGLVTTIIAAGISVLPAQSPSLLMLNNAYHFKFREFVSLSCVSTVTTIIISILAYYIYWPLLFSIVSW